MNIQEILDKSVIGISQLTGKVYVYYPEGNNNGVAKYKSDKTNQFYNCCKILNNKIEITDDDDVVIINSNLTVLK